MYQIPEFSVVELAELHRSPEWQLVSDLLLCGKSRLEVFQKLSALYNLAGRVNQDKYGTASDERKLSSANMEFSLLLMVLIKKLYQHGAQLLNRSHYLGEISMNSIFNYRGNNAGQLQFLYISFFALASFNLECVDKLHNFLDSMPRLSREITFTTLPNDVKISNVMMITILGIYCNYSSYMIFTAGSKDPEYPLFRPTIVARRGPYQSFKHPEILLNRFLLYSDFIEITEDKLIIIEHMIKTLGYTAVEDTLLKIVEKLRLTIVEKKAGVVVNERTPLLFISEEDLYAHTFHMLYIMCAIIFLYKEKYKYNSVVFESLNVVSKIVNHRYLSLEADSGQAISSRTRDTIKREIAAALGHTTAVPIRKSLQGESLPCEIILTGCFNHDLQTILDQI